MAIGNYGELKTASENWLAGRTDQTARVPEWIKLAEDRIAQDLRIRPMQNRISIRVKATVDGVTVGGTANAITLTPSIAATSYATGDRYFFDAASNNTGATAVDVSGLGTKNIKAQEGGIKRDPDADDIQAGARQDIHYDGTDFILIPPGGVSVPSRFIETRNLYLDGDDKKLDFFPEQDFWTRKAVNTTARPEMFTIEGDFWVLAPTTDTTVTLVAFYWRRFATLSADSDTNWVIDNATGLLLYGTELEAMLFLHDDDGALRYAQLYEDLLERVHKADRRGLFPAGQLVSRTEVPVI